MKKYIMALSCLILALGAFGQSSDNYDPKARFGFSLNNTWYSTAGPTFTAGDELWLRAATWSEEDNVTTADGSTAFSTGVSELEIQLSINNVLSGRMFTRNDVDNNDANGNVFTVYSKDDPDTASLTGKDVDRTGWTGGLQDNALTFFHRDNLSARRVGSYIFYEGNYFGGDGYHGIRADLFNSFTSYGASFVAGDHVDDRWTQSRTQRNIRAAAGLKASSDQTDTEYWLYNNSGDMEAIVNSAASGASLIFGSGSILIDNETGKDSDRFQAATYTSTITAVGEVGNYGQFIYALGGDGLTADTFGGGATVKGGDFYGSVQASGTSRSLNYTTFDTKDVTLNASGGRGAFFRGISSGVDIDGGNYYGGSAGSATAGGDDATAITVGGHGLVISGGGANNVLGGNYVPGQSQSAIIEAVGSYNISTNHFDYTINSASANNGSAFAYGASGIYLDDTGNTIVSGVTAVGSQGGYATANDSNSYANASGGNALYASSTAVTINSGSFIGANGGTAISEEGTAEAFGGAGVFVTDGNLIVNGGYFKGGAGGNANSSKQQGNIGIYVHEGNLTITTNTTDTEIEGDVVFANTTGKALTISAGSIGGDIYKTGAGLVTLSVSTNATYTGSFLQKQGDSAVTLSSSEESKFFTDVQITDGDMTFSGAKVLLADNARFNLGGISNKLNFGTAGAELGTGAEIDAGYNEVASGGDFVMGTDSVVTFNYDSLNQVSGGLNITGALVATNNNAKIRAAGISAVPSGTFKVATAGSLVGIDLNNVYDLVEVDFGWLTQIDTNETSLAGGITVGYKYNSLTNTSLADLGSILTYVDGVIVSLTNTAFYSLNAAGEANGDKLFRYSLSQLPDVSESSFQISQQLNGQIAARGTEFRSMNGFASTKPKFGTSPTGVAGPQSKPEEEKTMQGWVRAYGGNGSRDAEGSFAEYDSTSWGTVIGVDKSFGKLLVGLAGGYARTDLNAGAAYDANVDTYHGSLYSTFGGESLFIDLALTYGWSSTDEENGASAGSFDSSLYSAFLGAGYAFDVGEKISITPEASLLASYYDQEEYDRSGVLGSGTIKEYDTSSLLGSIGVSLATQHQLDWLNRGIAFMPEVRAHYTHEFNANPDDFTYVLGGTPTSFAVRDRDEDLFRFGFGFDMWSWKYASTKFEIDYDILTSDTYFEQIVSGKATWRF